MSAGLQQHEQQPSNGCLHFSCSAFCDPLPITEEWLESQGFQRVPSDRGPNYTDHFEKDRVNLWEFNGTGNWLWSEHDSVNMSTRGKLYLLAAWIGLDMPNDQHQATASK